jgi:hypothetical protein
MTGLERVSQGELHGAPRTMRDDGRTPQRRVPRMSNAHSASSFALNKFATRNFAYLVRDRISLTRMLSTSKNEGDGRKLPHSECQISEHWVTFRLEDVKKSIFKRDANSAKKTHQMPGEVDCTMDEVQAMAQVSQRNQ